MFIEEAGAFRVVFHTPLIPPKQKPEPKLVISEDELIRLNLDSDHYRILELVEAKGEVRPNEAWKHLGRSRPTSNRKLDELVEKRVLVRTTENKMDPGVAFRLHPRFLGPDALQTGIAQKQLL